MVATVFTSSTRDNRDHAWCYGMGGGQFDDDVTGSIFANNRFLEDVLKLRFEDRGAPKDFTREFHKQCPSKPTED